jgi:hypothetical protein
MVNKKGKKKILELLVNCNYLTVNCPWPIPVSNAPSPGMKVDETLYCASSYLS